MNEFDTIEKCVELFRSVGCIGNENNIFFAYKGPSTKVRPSLIPGHLKFSYNNFFRDPTGGVLINQCDNGIGMFMITQPGIPLTAKLEKMELQKDQFIFFKNEHIKEIKIKNAVLLYKKKKRIIITLVDNRVCELLADVNEPRLPYHNNGFAAFMQKYSAK
jgi:hypothetical protein